MYFTISVPPLQTHVWNSSFFWFDYILVSRTGLCSSSPCLNGGTCAEVDFGYICDCDGTGYAGDSCQRKYLKYPVLVPSELQKCTTTQASLWSKFFYKFFFCRHWPLFQCNVLWRTGVRLPDVSLPMYMSRGHHLLPTTRRKQLHK